MIAIKAVWNEAYDLQVSLSILRDLSRESLSLVHDRALARELNTLVRDENYEALCNYKVDYENMSTSDAINVRQALAYFTKFEELPLGCDKETVAYDKFVASELMCRDVNGIFRLMNSGGFHFLPSVSRVLYAAQRKISSVLGPCPRIEDLPLRLGPGSTTEVKKQDACVQAKLGGVLSCSNELAVSLELKALLRELPHVVSAHQCGEDYIDEDGYLCGKINLLVKAGRLQFVPKNAKTYRSIVVEPLLNGILQQGIGRFMAERLRRVGVDIKDQTRNQRLAREGSLDGTLATLDLSSASDTISYELVKFLLPYDWFRLLSSARTGSVEYRGACLQLDKFSSMGNGFTFPLETLIFWALSGSACANFNIGVYGDDIIVPTEKVGAVVDILTACGFSINTEKSCVAGSFRESCGADYLRGIPIRPVYVKDRVSAESLFVVHNFHFRAGSHELAEKVLEWIHPELRIFGPDGYGDGHLLCSDPLIHARRSRRAIAHGWGGFFFDTYTNQGRKTVSRFPGDYISPLYAIYLAGEGVKIVHPKVREMTMGLRSHDNRLFECDLPGSSGYKKISIYTLGWCM